MAIPEAFAGAYPPACCACGCGKPWEKWCRHCNLVYAAEHVERALHRCRPEVEAPPPAANDVPKRKRKVLR